MKTLGKTIAITGIFCALLLGGQLLLSGVKGVEIVTVLFLSFCVQRGPWQGMIVATVFSLLRCLLFGFFPPVVILYLVYYNLFALFFGLIFRKTELKIKNLLIVTACAALFTVLFTALDDVISPLFYGMKGNAWTAYIVASLPTLGIQIACTVLSVFFLLPPLIRVYRLAKI